MRPDIINAPALQDAIDKLLEDAPLALQTYMSALRPALRRALETHDSVRRARRRKSDPDWAQAKFAQGQTLYRFFPDDFLDWEVEDWAEELGPLAEVVSARGPGWREAASFLRGLPHQDRSLDDLRREARGLLRRAESAALRARRDEALRQPANVAVKSLTGTRCVSVQDIIRLGREAGNCLTDNEEHWKTFVEGQTDVWSLRQEGRLIAVIEAAQDGRVTEVLGPGNQPIGPAEAGPVASFCRAAGLTLTGSGSNLRPEFADPAVIDRRVVRLGRRIAVYSEWPTAVRIDLSVTAGNENGRRASFGEPCGIDRTLALSFDPARSCAEAVLGDDDPRDAIRRFGRKRLRRIVGTVAMGDVLPSLVQHRLLAMAA